jgi:phage-related minor tail protein
MFLDCSSVICETEQTEKGEQEMSEAGESMPPAAAESEPKIVAAHDWVDPVALSGTENVRLAKRLARQVATCQWLPPDLGSEGQAEQATSAVAALKELAPGNAVEALLATQMVAAHNASLNLLQRAMTHALPARTIEERTRQYARLSDVFLKQLDRFVRQRGRQRQTIRIEHVRVVEDGKVTVRQEEERVR